MSLSLLLLLLLLSQPASQQRPASDSRARGMIGLNRPAGEGTKGREGEGTTPAKAGKGREGKLSGLRKARADFGQASFTLHHGHHHRRSRFPLMMDELFGKKKKKVTFKKDSPPYLPFTNTPPSTTRRIKNPLVVFRKLTPTAEGVDVPPRGFLHTYIPVHL